MSGKITVRKLELIEDVRLIQSLESEVWQMNAIPIHQTYTAVQNGGLVLGAFCDEEIVGFSYSFPGFTGGKVYLCSHMLGIHPDYQSKGIGKMLKDEQCEHAIKMGYDLVTWTFDPLESRNAYLNLQKLYGISNVYLDNWYGEMQDGLNKGLPTDRLRIEWWISSERVQKQWMPKNIAFNRPVTVGKSAKGFPMIQNNLEALPITSGGIEIPVPEHIQSIKVEEPELAVDWRMKTRATFQKLFEAGYATVGVKRTDTGVHYYQFVQRSMIPLTNHEEAGESLNDY